MTTTCPICTMVKDEDNVICEDCNTKGLIEHGIQILKNQEKAEKLEMVDSLFAELEISLPYDLWLVNSLTNNKIIEHIKKRIEECKTNSNKLSIKTQWSEYILQERVGKELQKLIEGEKPQRITSTKEGRKFLGDFEATA